MLPEVAKKAVVKEQIASITLKTYMAFKYVTGYVTAYVTGSATGTSRVTAVARTIDISEI